MEEVEVILTLLLAAIAAYISTRKKRSPRRMWSREWLLKRDNEERGVLNTIENEIRFEDDNTYRTYLRMGEREFCTILDLIWDDIQKFDTNMRQSISARKRLTLTLRYLATGESFSSLSINSRISEQAVGRIVKETLAAIARRLKPIYLKAPSTVEEWNEIAAEFYQKWGFPNCCGAIDGKHFAFRPPKSLQPFFWNYKKFSSLVLLAAVDANRRFILVDAGANGRISDGGIFARSWMSGAIERNTLNLPPNKPLPGRQIPMPHVFILDNAFPLTCRLMKPYVINRLYPSQITYNKCLSSARQVVECAFGLLVNRFTVFKNTIEIQDPDDVELMIIVGCILHNFLIVETSTYDTDENLQAPLPDHQEEHDHRYNTGKNVRIEFLRFFASVCE